MADARIIRFTVFTPTYNRASTLPRLYDSLVCQTLRDFEWVIVDDGSSDGTEALVEVWRKEAPFSIRFFRQLHGGKHRAVNRGVREAQGELFAPTGSDDWLTPFALERLAAIWESIPSDDREQYCGVGVLSCYDGGRIVGGSYGKGLCDASFLEMTLTGRISGDRWGFMRTSVLRSFPYPEISGEDFIPDGLVWLRISGPFLMRFVDEPLRFVEYRADGLSKNLVAIRARNSQGVCLYYREMLSRRISVRHRFQNLSNLIRFSLHGAKPIIPLCKEYCGTITPCAVITGYIFYLHDLYSLSRSSKEMN